MSIGAKGASEKAVSRTEAAAGSKSMGRSSEWAGSPRSPPSSTGNSEDGTSLIEKEWGVEAATGQTRDCDPNVKYATRKRAGPKKRPGRADPRRCDGERNIMIKVINCGTSRPAKTTGKRKVCVVKEGLSSGLSSTGLFGFLALLSSPCTKT